MGQNLDRLAIIILGKPNAGKTTTLRHYCETYYHKRAIFREGWRTDMMPFKDKYYGVRINGFFIPASRTERNESLKDFFKRKKLDDDWPDFLFMAEQHHGAQYNNTIRHLHEYNYHIKEFTIDDSNQDIVWRHYEPKDGSLVLGHRTEQIADYVRGFIKLRI